MAQKRMFDKTITNSDQFLEMPDSSQNLYFHLSMNADDDGFVNNWKSIMRMTGHKDDDLKVLVMKNFIIPFDSGVIVIKHWRINNYLRNDRYVGTKFQKEKQKLLIDDNLVYQLYTNCIPSIDKNSIDKNSIDNKEIYKESFERLANIFYEAYPRKVAKTKVINYFITHKVTEELLNKMLAAIEKQKKSEQWVQDNGRYIPHPTTWLNQGRWEDEVSTSDDILEKAKKIIGEEYEIR